MEAHGCHTQKVVAMTPKEQETRETFRAHVVNDRKLYDSLHASARLLAANLRAAITAVNTEHAPQIDGAALIGSDADKRAAIGVYIDEIREVLEWELIGEQAAAARARYRVEETGGVVTVWDTGKRCGFRFKRGDTLARYTFALITPGRPSTPDAKAIDAATGEFMRYAAERFPAEFGTQIRLPAEPGTDTR